MPGGGGLIPLGGGPLMGPCGPMCPPGGGPRIPGGGGPLIPGPKINTNTLLYHSIHLPHLWIRYRAYLTFSA